MGFVSNDPFLRHGLVVCDECEHYFCHGTRSQRQLTDSTPEDWLSFTGDREETSAAASRAGWRETRSSDGMHARWSCPECAKART